MEGREDQTSGYNIKMDSNWKHSSMTTFLCHLQVTDSSITILKDVCIHFSSMPEETED